MPPRLCARSWHGHIGFLYWIHLPYTQPICVMAAGVRRPGRNTPTGFDLSWPFLGYARHKVGIFFSLLQLKAKKVIGVLEALVDFAIMKPCIPVCLTGTGSNASTTKRQRE